MKKSIVILLVIISIFVASCYPQVTVTRSAEVTVTSLLPAATVIPTPTLHPQFIALQEQITAEGERFTLLPDGTIEEQTADGGRQTVPGISVDSNGVMTIALNGEVVVVDPSLVHFGADDLQVNGYELHDSGEWQETAKALTPEQESFVDQMNELDIDPKSYSCGEDGRCRDINGKVIFESRVDFGFAQVELEKTGRLAPTNILPLGPGDAQEGSFRPSASDKGVFTKDLYLEFVEVMKTRNGAEPFASDQLGSNMVMLDPSKNAWGIVVGERIDGVTTNQYLVFRSLGANGEEMVEWIPVMDMTGIEIMNYWLNKAKN